MHAERGNGIADGGTGDGGEEAGVAGGRRLLPNRREGLADNVSAGRQIREDEAERVGDEGRLAGVEGVTLVLVEVDGSSHDGGLAGVAEAVAVKVVKECAADAAGLLHLDIGNVVDPVEIN